MRNKVSVFTLSVLCCALFSANALASGSNAEPGRSSAKANPLNNFYFGEQHLHTSAFPDAFAVGTRGDWFIFSNSLLALAGDMGVSFLQGLDSNAYFVRN